MKRRVTQNPCNEKEIGTPASPKPFQIDTYNPDLNADCEGLSPQECLARAGTFEKWAASIRRGVGRSGKGPYHAPHCLLEVNYYLKVGLSKSQIRRLKQAAAVFLNRSHRSSANAAWLLLNLALSNLEIMEHLCRQDDRLTKLNLVSNLEFTWEQKARAAIKASN
jgi:hypothetical protein